MHQQLNFLDPVAEPTVWDRLDQEHRTKVLELLARLIASALFATNGSSSVNLVDREMRPIEMEPIAVEEGDRPVEQPRCVRARSMNHQERNHD